MHEQIFRQIVLQHRGGIYEDKVIAAAQLLQYAGECGAGNWRKPRCFCGRAQGQDVIAPASGRNYAVVNARNA